jgi:hypothetical protein
MSWTRQVGKGFLAGLRIEETLKTGFDTFRGLQLAFPDNQYPPAEFAKSGIISLVSRCIALQFYFPVFPMGGGHGCFFTILVTMPKAAMNKDDFAQCRKYDIGLAG